MEINTLKDVTEVRRWGKKIGIKSIIDRIQKRMESHLPEGVEFSLTGLQKKALNHEDFWDDRKENNQPKHLIIQGATSAGKTLLSELAVIDTLQKGYSAIILVPLKAMVRERAEQFAYDMQETDYSVYGSSSDYQENDEKLINGDFNVAVIVYEKFFAMLSQSNCRILKRCQLVVVDELSMLSKDERGPKLEISLEMVQTIDPYIRIMCLATIDCKVSKIKGWLGDATIIEFKLRPIALSESIVMLDGSCWTRYIPGEKEANTAEKEENELDIDSPMRKFEIPGYRSDQREQDKRLQLLKAIIQQEFKSESMPKILIFVPNRDDTIRIARFLKENLPDYFPKIELDQKFTNDLNACDNDEDKEILLKETLPYGIAYHNAGVSTNLRELIEKEFPDSTALKVIVATETLTIGVNMPFDAMIMLNNEVPRGVGPKQPLTYQEYRNFIGRAGRLGQSNKKGLTYLLVADKKALNTYWSVDADQKEKEITSALANAKAENQAPYYLSLLAHRSANSAMIGTEFVAEDVKALYDTSFSNACDGKVLETGNVINHLYENMLVDLANESPESRRRRKSITRYALSEFGKKMAPYALAVNTCYRIYYYFVAKSEEREPGGMPNNINQKDISNDCYLLDFLYLICMHEEVKRSSVLTYVPGDGRTETVAKISVFKAFDRLLNEKDESGAPKYRLWEGSELKSLLDNQATGDVNIRLQAAVRTLLLFYWTKGKLMREIKELTNLERYVKKIINGDFERLAEVVSYHLEAITNGLAGVSQIVNGERRGVFEEDSAFSAMYSLVARIKYGMPRDMVVLANKHVHGLDRSRIIAFERFIQSTEFTTLQCLYAMDDLSRFLTKKQQQTLREQLERRNTIDSNTTGFDVWMEILRNDREEFDSEVETGLRSLFNWNGKREDELIAAFRAVMRDNGLYDFRGIEDKEKYCFEWTYREPEKETTFYVAVLPSSQEEKQILGIKDFFCKKRVDSKKKKGGTRILIIDSEQLDKSALEGLGFDCAVTSAFLSLIFADAIRLERCGANALAAFLHDIRGVFSQEDIVYCSLANYVSKISNSDSVSTSIGYPREPRFRILHCRRNRKGNGNLLDSESLVTELIGMEEIGPFEELVWGTNLDEIKLTALPLIIVLDRKQVQHSRWLTELLYYLGHKNDYDNTLLLFGSKEKKDDWYGEIQNEKGVLKWNPLYQKVNTDITPNVQEAVDKIAHFVKEWYSEEYLIGVSYAHYEPEKGINEMWESDTKKLKNIVDRLKSIHRERNILFDQYFPAHYLFYGNNNRQNSLKAYSKCKLFLILYNTWTKENKHCQDELKEILKACKNKGAQRVYFQASHTNPSLPYGDSEFYESLDNDMDVIIDMLEEKLKEANPIG